MNDKIKQLVKEMKQGDYISLSEIPGMEELHRLNSLRLQQMEKIENFLLNLKEAVESVETDDDELTYIMEDLLSDYAYETNQNFDGETFWENSNC